MDSNSSKVGHWQESTPFQNSFIHIYLLFVCQLFDLGHCLLLLLFIYHVWKIIDITVIIGGLDATENFTIGVL